MGIHRFSVRLRFVRLTSVDLRGLRRFYGDLLGLRPTVNSANDFIQFWTGSVDLCAERADHPGSPVMIFSVDDLAELHRALDNASVVVEGPIAGPHRLYSVVHDPDGNMLIFEEERVR